MAFHYSPKIVTDGLVLYLDAANTKSYVSGSTSWNDISRGGNNGTLINGPTFNSANSGSIVLDGVNEYITINNSVTSQILSPSVATFTIWLRANDTFSNDNRCSIISRGNYNTSGGYFIHLGKFSGNCQVLASFSRSTTTSYSFDSTSWITIDWGVWNQITVSVGNNITLYVNGIQKSSVARLVSSIIYGNGTINTNGDTNIVLCSSLSYAPTLDQGSGGIWRPYNGNTSIFTLYNRVLTPQEVLQNYNATKSRYGLL
jgi:hypothetical protein